MLQGKKILLGITGSIAAYKSILLVRLLVKAGAEVKVVITPSAKDFVSPLTLSTLSRNDVLSDLFDESSWSNHVMLGRWADVMVIAPLSCNTLAKSTIYLLDLKVAACLKKKQDHNTRQPVRLCDWDPGRIIYLVPEGLAKQFVVALTEIHFCIQEFLGSQ